MYGPSAFFESAFTLWFAAWLVGKILTNQHFTLSNQHFPCDQ